MDAIPYVDSLIKEYLLFRGFTGSLQAFNKDLASDRGRGFQADQLCELVFRKLLPLDHAAELMEVLDFLSNRVYSRLPGSYEGVIRKLEVSILRAYIVKAVQANKLAVVQGFFSQYGELLLQRTESSDWLQWFALPYLKDPSQDARFQVFFSRDWLALVELSFRNFLAKAIQHLPLPTLLRFDSDRLQRTSLQKQVERLQTEIAGLRHQPPAPSKSKTAASPQQNPHRQQPQAGSAQPGAEAAVKDPVQERARPIKDDKASAPSTAPQAPSHGQHYFSEASKPNSASEASQLVQVDGHSKQDSASPADETAAERSAAKSLEQLESHIQPGWSASLTSLASSVLADSGAEAPPNQNAAVGEIFNLDTDVSSPRIVREQTQVSIQADSPHASLESAPPLPCRLPYGRSQVQGKPSNGKLQPTARLQPQKNEAEQDNFGRELAQHGTKAAISTGQPGSASELASRQESARGQPQAAVEQLASHDQGITCCSFSPSGQNLATASSDGVVRISAPASLQGNTSRAAVLNCSAPVSAVAWDHRADKVMLVGTKGRGVKAWHLDTKSMVSHIQLDPAHPTVMDIACSPTDPSFVCAAASSDATRPCSGALAAWSMRAFKRLRSFDVSDGSAVGSTSFSPDGRTLVAGVSDGSLQIFDVQSSKSSPVATWALQMQQKQAPAVRYYADGSAIVSLSQAGQLQQWDLRRLSSKKLGHPQWSVDLSQFCVPAPKAQRHALSTAQTGRMIATTSANMLLPVVTVHEVPRTPSLQHLVGGVDAASSAFVSTVHWHATSPTLCCGLSNGQVCLRSSRAD